MLASAYFALWHDDTHHADMDAADAHIIVAINLLNAYRERLGLLGDLAGEETLLKAGGTKNERGDWTMPDGWGIKAAA